MDPEEDDEIYGVPSSNEKIVSDLGKIRSMFEQKPMPVYTPGKPTLNPKHLQKSTAQINNPPPVKPKPGQLIMPQGFQNELQNKQKQISAGPVLPKKDRRTSININGEVVSKAKDIVAPPTLPKKTPGKLDKPVVPGKPKPVLRDKNDNVTALLNGHQNNLTGSKDSEKKADVSSDASFDNNVEYIGEAITEQNGEKYQQLKCLPSPGPAPSKRPLPSKIDIDDILAQYAEDDDMYDDVLTEDPDNRVSVIPEFTEEEERELAVNAKQVSVPKDFEQEEYSDVRVANADRKEKSISMMSTGSDIYETFDEVDNINVQF